MRNTRILAEFRHLQEIARSASWRTGVRVLRRAAVRDRAASLRPPAGRDDQGCRAALSDHARQLRRAAVRLGLPRTPG